MRHLRATTETRNPCTRPPRRIAAAVLVSLALTGAGAAAAVDVEAASPGPAVAPTRVTATAASFMALSRTQLTATDLAGTWARDREEIAEAELHRRTHHPTRDPVG